jgi:hypothetical protein
MTLTAAAGLLLATAPTAPAAPYAAAVLPTATSATLAPMAPAVASVAPLQDPKITVEVKDNTTRTSWYTQPIWLAIGGVALVVIILIAVLAGRAGRGNTTVVK